DARGHPAEGPHEAAPAAQRRGSCRNHAADRTGAIHGQPHIALHLSVCGAADARGVARHEPARLRAVHQSPTQRAGAILPQGSPSMSAPSLVQAVEERALRSVHSISALTCCLCVHAALVCAQPREPRGQTLQLATLQQQALAADPRTRELQLHESQTALRLRMLDAERLPSVALLGQAQYQSDVPTAPFALPDGRPLFAPPKDTYDASFRVDQRLFDPTRHPRAAVEQAQLAESQARVRALLFGLRQEVNDAFFAGALLQAQLRELD